MWTRFLLASLLTVQTAACAPSAAPPPAAPLGDPGSSLPSAERGGGAVPMASSDARTLAAARSSEGASSTTLADIAREKQAIGAVLDDWHDAAAHANEARYFGHFAGEAVFLGTDATERWDVPAFRAYAHPHFARGKAWSFRAVRRAVTVAPGALIAWFDEDLDTPNLGPARGSGVLVRDTVGAPWRIAQYNLCATIPNERFDEVKRLLGAPSPSTSTTSSAAPPPAIRLPRATRTPEAPRAPRPSPSQSAP